MNIFVHHVLIDCITLEFGLHTVTHVPVPLSTKFIVLGKYSFIKILQTVEQIPQLVLVVSIQSAVYT